MSDYRNKPYERVASASAKYMNASQTAPTSEHIVRGSRRVSIGGTWLQQVRGSMPDDVYDYEIIEAFADLDELAPVLVQTFVFDLHGGTPGDWMRSPMGYQWGLTMWPNAQGPSEYFGDQVVTGSTTTASGSYAWSITIQLLDDAANVLKHASFYGSISRNLTTVETFPGGVDTIHATASGSMGSPAAWTFDTDGPIQKFKSVKFTFTHSKSFSGTRDPGQGVQATVLFLAPILTDQTARR